MERYGTVPKKFTKDWWPYFWDYYKWRVIGIALAIVIIVVTCVQCATREKYDFHVLYTGRMTFSDNHVETIQNALNERIEDVDGDGKTNIFFHQLKVSGDAMNAEYDYGISQRFDIEVMSGDAALFFLSEEELNKILGAEMYDYAFVPVADWAQQPVPKSETVDQNGVPTAVNLKNSPFLNAIGFYTDDLYMLVRIKVYGDDEINQKRYDAAVEAANIMIEGM